jgi:hypothetical protein
MQDDAALIPSKVTHGIFKQGDPISEDTDDASSGSFEYLHDSGLPRQLSTLPGYKFSFRASVCIRV